VRKQGIYALKRHRISVNRFVEMFGNVPVGAVTKKMVRAYIEKLEELPDNRRLPAKMRGRMVEADADIPRISAPTIDRHLTTIKALLTFCVEREWLVANAATGLRAPKDTRPKSGKRRPFTGDERRQLLARAKAEDTGNSDMPWFIQIVAYTGARLEEIAQLSVGDIREIDGVWVVDIHDLDGNNLKTRDSVKQIPLHPAIREDFLDWVKSRTGKRLFKSFELDKDGRFSKNVSGKVGRLMDRADLSDPTIVLHSLRHTLKREMSNAGIDPDVRRLILGHAPKDAHDRYASHSLEAVAREFARMPALF
jgi:integrase